MSTLEDPVESFNYEVEGEDWKREREPWYFPPPSGKNDRRRVLQYRKFQSAQVPFMDYRQNVRDHPDDSG